MTAATTAMGGAAEPRRRERAGAAWTAVLVLAILAGVALRFAFDLGDGLWEDEVIAATHAQQPAGDLLVGVVRQDIHPPLYFLQLHFWALFGHGDRWLVLDSVYWGLAGIASMWASTRLRADGPTALAAAAFMAVLPSAYWMSHELRPYAMMCVALIWAFHFVDRAFAEPDHRRWHAPAAFALCLAIAYTHAIGFLAAFFLAAYALARLAARRAALREYVGWAACFGLLGVACLPILASNMMHDANLTSTRTIEATLVTLSTAITSADLGRGAIFLTGLAAYASIVVLGMAMPRTRAMAACLILLPLATAAGLDLLVKPVFKPNFFSTLLTPFVALVLARATLAIPASRRVAGTAALLAAVAAFAAATWTHRWPITGFKEAAARIQPQLRAGDVVYAPQMSMFWGMARYLDGPDWGDPLAVANPPNAPWRRVYDRLGPGVVAATHLMPTTQSIPGPDGSTLLIGEDSLPQAEAGRRVWLVTTPRADLPAGFPPERIGDMAQRSRAKVRNLVVTLYERAATGP